VKEFFSSSEKMCGISENEGRGLKDGVVDIRRRETWRGLCATVATANMRENRQGVAWVTLLLLNDCHLGTWLTE
jgi:hypothetical protein